MIRLLAFDLDGTMLNGKRRIPDANKEAVAAAVRAGVLAVPASGRIEPSMRPFAEELGLNGAMICGNGAHVIDVKGDELLHVGLDAATTQAVLEYAEANRLHLNVYSRSTLRFLADTPWGDVYRSRVGAVVPGILSAEERRTLSPTKIMIIASPEELAHHRPAVEELVDPDCARLVISEPEYLEVLSASASKGTGLKALAAACGIDRSEVAAIGDYLNDIEMVQWAGLSGAVANAAPEVAAAAAVVVGSNDDSGVAEFIYDHVLAGRPA